MQDESLTRTILLISNSCPSFSHGIGLGCLHAMLHSRRVAWAVISGKQEKTFPASQREGNGYFQPALSIILTASALFLPSSDKLMLSALNSPQPFNKALAGTPALTGYSWLFSAYHA